MSLSLTLYNYLPYGGFYVPVSDVEKTLIDLVYFHETPGADVLREIAKRAAWKVLKEYLSRYSEAFVRGFRSLF